jgi:hypothetical protein
MIVVIKGDDDGRRYRVPLRFPVFSKAKIAQDEATKCMNDFGTPSLMRNAFHGHAAHGTSGSLEEYVSYHLGVGVSALYSRVIDTTERKRGPYAPPALTVKRIEDESSLVGGMIVCACVEGDTDPPPMNAFSPEATNPCCAVM